MAGPWEKYQQPKEQTTTAAGSPWEKYAKQQPKAKTETKKTTALSKLKAGLSGAAAGATLGFYDEIRGGIEAAIKLATESYKDSPGYAELYKQQRDEVRRELKQLEEENPEIFLAGEVAGGIATTAIPGMLAARGAGAIARAGKLAATVAKSPVKVGAAAGAGFSEEESVMEIAKDAAQGALVGGAFKQAGKIGSKFTKKHKERLRAEKPKFRVTKQKERIDPFTVRNRADNELIRKGKKATTKPDVSGEKSVLTPVPGREQKKRKPRKSLLKVLGKQSTNPFNWALVAGGHPQYIVVKTGLDLLREGYGKAVVRKAGDILVAGGAKSDKLLKLLEKKNIDKAVTMLGAKTLADKLGE